MNIKSYMAVAVAALTVAACSEKAPDALTATTDTTNAAAPADAATATPADAATATPAGGGGGKVDAGGREQAK